MKIGRMVLSMCATNCYYFYREEDPDKRAVMVDVGDQGGLVYEALRKEGLSVEAILLTHGHFDHIWGVNELRAKSGARVYAWEAERELLLDEGLNVSREAGRAEQVEADVYVKDGEVLTLAGCRVRLIGTPGHTAGSCCYYLEEENTLFSGDTLFEDSVGRTDLPTGSLETLVRSVRDRLFILPPETRVYPGHGEETTIGTEKRYNPYCQ